MYACAYINIGILISTYVHMHTNGRRNMLFFPIFSNDFSRWRQAEEEESASHFRMPCAADKRSARFGTMRAFHIADMKNPWTNFVHGFGADDQTWTGDLILTKDVLYHLSHISIFLAEAEGFEPPWAFTQTVFKTASLWPLRYASIRILRQTFLFSKTVLIQTVWRFAIKQDTLTLASLFS